MACTSCSRPLSTSPKRSSVNTITSRGIECAVHTWISSEQLLTNIQSERRSHQYCELDFENPPDIKGVVIIYHGYGAHSRFPTVRYLAELLSKSDYVVYGLDFPGHGLSPGLRGYVGSSRDLIEDGVNIFAFAKKRHPNIPIFLAGASMGGAIAIAVAERISKVNKNALQGMLLLAPMIRINVSCLHKTFLRVFRQIMPKVGISTTAEEDTTPNQYNDPARRAEALKDDLSYSGSLRVASAQSCLDLSTKVKRIIPEITCPFLCLIASNDVIVDNEGSMELMMRSPSQDKTLKAYNALHGLLCEKKPLRVEIERDIIHWLNKRSKNNQESKRDIINGRSEVVPSYGRCKELVTDGVRKVENHSVLQDLENALFGEMS